MAKTYNLSVATGKYHNTAGEEKTRWTTFGGVFEEPTGEKDENGKPIKRVYGIMDRTFNPAGVPDLDPNGQYRGGSGLLFQFFSVEEKDNNQ